MGTRRLVVVSLTYKFSIHLYLRHIVFYYFGKKCLLKYMIAWNLVKYFIQLSIINVLRNADVTKLKSIEYIIES